MKKRDRIDIGSSLIDLHGTNLSDQRVQDELKKEWNLKVVSHITVQVASKSDSWRIIETTVREKGYDPHYMYMNKYLVVVDHGWDHQHDCHVFKAMSCYDGYRLTLATLKRIEP